MVFVAPQDPRYQSLGQIGSNFGGGLGDALIQYIENKRFNTALGGLNPNSPIQDVLQQFAQHNVSPELQQRYFSSPVQQGLQRERGKQDIQNLSQADFSNLSPLQAVIKAMELTQNAPPGTLETFLPAFIQAQQNERFQNLYGGGRTGTLGQKPMQPSTEQAGQSAEGYSPAYNAPQQFEQPMQAAQPSTAAPFIRSRVGGATGPQGSRGFQRNLTLEDSIRNAYARGAQTKEQALFEAQLEQDTQQKQKEQEETDEENFKSRFQSRFKGQIEPWFENFGVEDFRYQTGTANERAEKAIKNVQNIKSGLNGLKTAHPRGFGEAFLGNKLNRFYKNVGKSINTVFNKAAVPEALKPGLIDETWVALSERNDMTPIGIAESFQNSNVNPNFKKEIALIKRLPSIPEVSATIPHEYAQKSQILSPKLEKNRAEVVNSLMKILENPYSSPLTIKAKLLEKGYPDDWIAQRFEEAQSLGWQPSSYQGREVDLLGIPTYQSVSTSLQGQPSLIGLPTKFMGIR